MKLRRNRRITWACLATIGLLASALPSYGITLTQGIDISHYQNTINWPNVAADATKSIKFAFMKATQGTTYVDPTFTYNFTNATAAGILAGPYHFCEVSSTNVVADAAAEANHFLASIKSYYKSGQYLPPVADVEGTLPSQSLTSQWIVSFSNTIYNSLGVRPLIYSNKSSANSHYDSSVTTVDPLWVAWWKTTGTNSPPSTSDVSPWTAWKFWQWSNDTATYPSNGPINGFTGVRVDRDVFNGTATQLKALLIGKDTAKPGDFNRDGLVNMADYNLWSTTNGQTVPIYSGADANGNAKVDSSDLAVWVSNTPEPGSSTLVLIGLWVAAFGSARERRLRTEFV